MSNPNQPQQADANIAMQYLGEVAQTYAATLNQVEKAPFINQVNTCMRVINEDREQMAKRLKALSDEVTALREHEMGVPAPDGD